MVFDAPPKPIFSQVQQAASSVVKPFYKVMEKTREFGGDASDQKKERDRQNDEIERGTDNKGNIFTSQRR